MTMRIEFDEKWPKVPLGEVAVINPKLDRRAGIPPDSRVTFLPMAAVSETGRIITQEERSFSDVSKGYTYFEEGDVLLAKITPCMENGKAALAEGLKHQIGFGSTEFHVLRPSKLIDKRYLFHAVWNSRFRQEAERNMTGTAGQKRVPSEFLRSYTIPLPQISEQKRIAAILDKTDGLRRKRQEAIRLSEEFLRSVFLEMFGDPVTNPKGWPIRTIDQIVCDPKTGVRCGPFGTQLKVDEIVRSGVPLLGIENVHRNQFLPSTKKFITQEKANYLRSFSVEGGDVLITRMGTIGRACVVPAEIGEARFSYHLFRVRTNKNVCLPDFLSATINRSGTFQRQLQAMAHGAIMDGLSTGNLREVKFVVPPIEKQKEYIAVVRTSEHLQKQYSASALNYEELFNSIISTIID